MRTKTNIDRSHPLRKLFRQALDFGVKLNPTGNKRVLEYLEEQILCEFIHIDNLYKIKDLQGTRLEDIADILYEGDLLLETRSFSMEFQVHKHIGDTHFLCWACSQMLCAEKEVRILFWEK